jgi:hypothetical protein
LQYIDTKASAINVVSVQCSHPKTNFLHITFVLDPIFFCIFSVHR